MLWSAARVDHKKNYRIFRFLNIHNKIAFYPNQNFFSQMFTAWNVGSDWKIKKSWWYGHFKYTWSTETTVFSSVDCMSIMERHLCGRSNWFTIKHSFWRKKSVKPWIVESWATLEHVHVATKLAKQTLSNWHLNNEIALNVYTRITCNLLITHKS